MAELFDVSHSAVANWARGRIPHARRTGRPTVRASGPPESGTIVADRIPAMEVPVDASEREAFEAAMVENQLLRAVLADLKAGGSSPDSISNRRKTELGERLREATGRSLREITDFLRISKSSYEYHRRRLGRDKYAALRARIVSLFEEGDGNWGYRTIWAHLRRDPESPVAVSEKVVRRIMAEVELLHHFGQILEGQSSLSKLDRAHVAERRMHPLVVVPPHIRVDLVTQLIDGRVAPAVYRRRLERLVHRFDGGVVVGVALARERSRDPEDLEHLVDGHVVELGSPIAAKPFSA